MSPATAPLTGVQSHLPHRYEIHGYGGNVLVEARLTPHGKCSHVTWEPGPPAWRLHFDTALTLDELQTAVKDLVVRYDLRFYELA